MHRHHQDEVKVAVCSANMSVPEEQQFQDVWLAALMFLSALSLLGLRYLA